MRPNTNNPFAGGRNKITEKHLCAQAQETHAKKRRGKKEREEGRSAISILQP